MEQVRPCVQRAVRQYNPSLRLIRNPKWEPGDDPYYKHYIAQRVNRMQLTNIEGIVTVKEDWYPVLFIPNISEIDERWFINLHNNKFANREDAGKRHMDKMIREREQHAQMVRDYATDRGYWFFKKQMGDHYNPCVRPQDPSRDFKKLQDDLGRMPH
jgi:hypothetical protein